MTDTMEQINTLDEASDDKALPLLYLCEIRIKTLLGYPEDDIIQDIQVCSS
jgi:hypothetical protein